MSADLDVESTKVYNTVPIDATERIRKQLNLTENEMSYALGYASGSTYSNTKRKGVIQKTAALAAETLLARHTAENQIFVLIINKNGASVKEVKDDNHRITLDNQTYILVPEPK